MPSVCCHVVKVHNILGTNLVGGAFFLTADALYRNGAKVDVPGIEKLSD